MEDACFPVDSVLGGNGTYESKSNSASHGEKFQKEFALALSLRMWKNESTYELAYEMTRADKFDDIVLIDDRGKEKHFLQTKHGNAKDGSVIHFDMEALFPSGKQHGGDFDLFKYLESYMIVNHKFKEDEKNEKHMKMFYIVTNKVLKNADKDESTEWVKEIKEREVNEFLRFPGAQHYKLTPTNNAIEKLREYINKDFIDVKKAILKVFDSGEVDSILEKYSYALTDVLTIDGKKKYKFSVNFKPNSTKFSVAKLYNELISVGVDMEKEATVKKDFLQNATRKPNNLKLQSLPTYVSDDEVREFFNEFTLSVGHANDMQTVIKSELRTWMKMWIPPDDLGKRSKTNTFNGLMAQFEECIKLHADNRRHLSQKRDRDQCFENIENEIKNDINNYAADEIHKHYIHRQISYEDSAVINDTKFVTELQGLFKARQHILVVADPGMGKTSLLQFVAFQVQKENDVNVFLVYFSDLVETLDKIQEISGFNHVLDIFSTVLSKENCEFLRNAPDPEDDKDGEVIGFSIVLVMDGFDELQSKYTKKVTKMLQQLYLKKSIQIVISSRAQSKASLEKILKVRSMVLEPFSQTDQVNYLREMWNVQDDDEESFSSYSGELLAKLHSSMQSNLCDISGLPLMLRMLAELHTEKFKHFLEAEKTDTRQSFDLSEDALNIVQLYEQVVRKCFQKKFKEKYQISGNFDDSELDSMFEGNTLEHQLLAMKLLAIKELGNLFKNPRYRKKYENFRMRCETESDKSILIKVISKNVQFCHQSYSEYFVAKYLCDHIFTLEEKHVLNILSEHHVIRKLLMMMLGEDETYFEILNKLCERDRKIAMWACESGCLSMVSSLEGKFGSFDKKFSVLDSDYSDFNAAFEKHLGKRNALQKAIEEGHVEKVKLLLSYKTDIKFRKASGRTLLHTAAQNGKVDVAKALIENICQKDLNERDDNQWTALHLAANKGHNEVVQLLVEKGADINSRTFNGSTPLHMAVQKGYMGIIQLFIAHKCKLNEKDNKGWTALHFAAQKGCVEVINELIMNDADTKSLTETYETPLQIAAREGNKDVVEIFLKK